MKIFKISIYLLLSSCTLIYSQDYKNDFPVFSVENLEFTALKSFFYLIRQEYVLLDKTGNAKVRGDNDYYGKAYTIGVIDEDSKLWFPKYIRSPWEIDDTFDKQINKNYKPVCSNFCRKSYAEKEFFKTKILDLNEEYPLYFLLAGKKGITLEKTSQNSGTLVIFYTSAASPDDFELITYSLMFLEDISWSKDGIAHIEELNYGKNKIIGGALFSRSLNPGIVSWKLSGFYIPEGDSWIVKSIIGN